jgi:DNA-binding PadR family transcriptional regulator
VIVLAELAEQPRERRMGSQARRLYKATTKGRAALKVAKAKLRELVGEVIEGRERKPVNARP